MKAEKRQVCTQVREIKGSLNKKQQNQQDTNKNQFSSSTVNKTTVQMQR